jgi:hypothetical protein
MREARKGQQNRHGGSDHGGHSTRLTPSPSRDQASDSEERSSARFALFGRGTYGGPTPYGDAKALVFSRKMFATASPILSEAAPKATTINADTVLTVTAHTPKHPLAPTIREKAERGLRHGAHPPRRKTVKAQTGLYLSQASAFSTITTIFLCLTTTDATDSSSVFLPYTVLENQYD